MSPPRPLLLDEMLSAEIAVQLRRRAHDVTAVVETPDLVGLPDEELLAHAATEQRCLVTLNIRDFAALDAQWTASGRGHAGLVYVTTAAFPQNRAFLGAVVEALHALLCDGRLPESDGVCFLPRS